MNSNSKTVVKNTLLVVSVLVALVLALILVVVGLNAYLHHRSDNARSSTTIQ